MKLTAIAKQALEQQNESIATEAAINQVNLSSEEYQKMKKFKAFKQHEWKWNGDTQLWTKKQK